MLEIHQRYVLDETGSPIAVQIPIAQFETLLDLLDDRDQVSLVTSDGDWTVEELRKAATIGLQALEAGRYTDYDAAESLQGFFDSIKRNSRDVFLSQAGIFAGDEMLVAIQEKVDSHA